MTRGWGAVLLLGVALLSGVARAQAPDTDHVTLTLREDEPSAWQSRVPGSLAGGDAPTFAVTVPPPHGVIEHGDQGWRYRPAQDWYGEDAATLAWCVAPARCHTTTVKLRVTPVNDPPALAPLTLTTHQDLPSAPMPLVVSDPDARRPPTLAIIGSERGSATLEQDRLRFTPDYGVTGTARVDLMLCDEAGACVEAAVPVRIRNVNDPPRLTVTPLALDEDAGPTPLAVTVRDPDPADRYDLAVTLAPAHGEAAATPDRQQITYTPAADFHGEDHFFIAACDAAQACADARVSVTVRPVNDPPARVLLTLVTKQGQGTDYVTPLVLDADADDQHQLSLLSPPEGVYLELDAARAALRALPQPGFSGAATFLLQACDAAGACVVNDAFLDVIPTVTVAPEAGTLPVALLAPEALAEQAVDILRTEPLALYGTPAAAPLTGVVRVDAQLDASAPLAYRLGEVTLHPGEERFIAYVDVDAHAGRLELPIAPLPTGPVPAGAGGLLHLRVSEPHAPDVRVPLALWDPGAAIDLRASQAQFAANVEPVRVHASSGDPRCADGVRVVREPLPRAAPGRATRYCALRWLELPDGLTQVADSEVAQLSGVVTGEGSTARIRYQPGLLVFADPQGPGRFLPGREAREFTLALARPRPPALFVIPVSDNPTGQAYTADGPWPAAERAAHVVARGDYPGLTLTLDEQTHATPHHQVQARLPDAPARITATAHYPAAPHLTAQARLDRRPGAATPTPRLAALDQPPLAGAPVTVHGRLFGLSAPLPPEGGGWQVQLCQLTAGQPPTALTAAQALTAATGAFVFADVSLPAGDLALAVRAERRTADGDGLESLLSAPLAVTVADPAPVAVTLRAPRPQGAVPFVADLRVELARPEQAAALGEVRWESSADDGATWTPVPPAALSPPGLAYAPTLTAAGARQYRVTSVNRFSGATQVAPVVTLRAFDVPDIALVGFADTYLGRATPWRVVSSDPAPLRYRWRLERADGAAPPVELEGATHALGADLPGALTVTVAARRADAPEVPEAWRTVRRPLHVGLPPLRPPRLSGPARVRAGEPATYHAHTAATLDATGDSGWRLGGQWHLPDGTRVAGPQVHYTPAAGDRPLRYEYWLEGHADATRASVTLAPEIWSYRWPDWRLFTQTLRPYAPARVYYELKPDPPDALGAEPVTTTWDVPPGGVIEDRQDAGIVVRYDRPGSHAVSARVRDTHGHAAELSHVFDALEPPPLGVTLTLTAADPWRRAPETVTATWEVAGLTETEVIETVTLTVDDREHALTSREGARFPLDTPGEHRVRVAIRTNYGRTADDLRGLVLTTGVPPHCTIDSVMPAGQPRTLHARCTAAQGEIRRYHWVIRYADNGAEQAVTTRGGAIRLSRQAMQRGVAAVTLVARDDKDQASAAVQWPPP